MAVRESLGWFRAHLKGDRRGLREHPVRLFITGAGLEEIRLRPGSYRVQADKDGKPVPLDKDLVEVTRGGRAIVKVKLEARPTAVAGSSTWIPQRRAIVATYVLQLGPGQKP